MCAQTIPEHAQGEGMCDVLLLAVRVMIYTFIKEECQ